jgi:hypothetical protein
LKLIPLSAASPRPKSYFSTPQKELPLVALLRQEKLAFSASGLSASIGAIDVSISVQYIGLKSSL